MNARKLIELVEENKETDLFTFAKIIEQEERAFISEKATALGFPGIIPLIENN